MDESNAGGELDAGQTLRLIFSLSTGGTPAALSVLVGQIGMMTAVGVFAAAFTCSFSCYQPRSLQL
jgi:hypothetical protein